MPCERPLQRCVVDDPDLTMLSVAYEDGIEVGVVHVESVAFEPLGLPDYSEIEILKACYHYGH